MGVVNIGWHLKTCILKLKINTSDEKNQHLRAKLRYALKYCIEIQCIIALNLRYGGQLDGQFLDRLDKFEF